MEKKRKRAAAIIGGAIAAVGLGYLLIKSSGNGGGDGGNGGNGPFLLKISAGLGGTTLPAPNIQGYSYAKGTVVTVRATYDMGYSHNLWKLNGYEVARDKTSYAITMNKDQTLTITFSQEGQKTYLKIYAGVGGTTDPAPNSTGWSYNVGAEVTVTATILEAGYARIRWWLDNVPVRTDTALHGQLGITMAIDHTLEVEFMPPEATQILGNPVRVIQNIKVHSDSSGWGARIRFAHIGPNWTTEGNFRTIPMVLVTADKNGNPVPNIRVKIWTSSPDTGRYGGWVRINDNFYSSTNPLLMISDADGEILLNLGYEYGLPDSYQLIGKDLAVTIHGWIGILPTSIIVYDGLAIQFLAFESYSGGGESITTANPIFASFEGDSGPRAQILLPCGFNVQWK